MGEETQMAIEEYLGATDIQSADDTTNQGGENRDTTGQGDEGEAAEGQTGETAAEQPGDADPKEDKRVPLAALKDERRKRQSAEETLRKLEQRLAYIEGQQSATKQPKQEFEWREESVLEDIPGAFKTVESRLDERLRKERYEQSHELAKAMYDDYDEVMSHLNDVAKEIPSLPAALDSSRQPAILAYREIKRHLQEKQTPKMSGADFESEVSKRVKEELEKLKREINAEGLPTPMSSARGSGGATASGVQWSGPAPLEDLFGGR
jgi:chromosome segregation ATPase